MYLLTFGDLKSATELIPFDFSVQYIVRLSSIKRNM